MDGVLVALELRLTHLGGDATVKGSAITSTQKAIDEGKNSFATGGTLTLSDIENSAQYKASGWSATATVAGQASS